MPIHDYRCRSCENVFEFFVQYRKEKPVCPKCGCGDVVRLLSVPGAIRMGKSGAKGKTCCGRDERCDTPPCSDGNICRRDGGNG